MLRLRSFKPGDADHILNWIKDEKDYMRWSAGRFGPYPLSWEAFLDYFEDDNKNDGAWAFTVFDEEGPVGFFTLRYPEKNFEEVKLGFVLVDSIKRGKGYGKELVEYAKKLSFEFLHAEELSLGVFSDNAPAYNCYKACGFTEPEERISDTFSVMGEEWEIVLMYMTKEMYFAS